MTDKEILAELKKSYEYLQDIRENGCNDHCGGQMNSNINLLEQAIDNISTLYGDFYKTLDIEQLRIKQLEYDSNRVYISDCVDGDYKEVNNTHEEVYFTCGDVDYYWYDDEEYLLGDVDYD